MQKISMALFFVTFLLSPLAVAQDDDTQLFCQYQGMKGPGQGKHIVLLSGDEEYRSEEAMPMLGKMLSQRHGFKCTVIFAINPEDGTIDPNNQNNMPGLEQLESADLVIMSLRFRNLPDDQMIHFDKYVKSGKPIIGLRTSTHAFNIPKDAESNFQHYSFNSREGWVGGFGQQVLGDTWISHHGGHKVQATGGVIEEEFKDHPILTGVDKIWGPTDVYGIRNLPESADILVRGAVLKGMDPEDPPIDGPKNDPMMPLIWAKSFEHADGTTNQIVCTTMGSSNDFLNEGLRRVVVNSTFWLLDMKDEIQADLNVEPVGEFKPTMYGFNSWTKGMKPSDFNLSKEADQ